MRQFLFFFLFLFSQLPSVLAQCPIANNCTPANAPAPNHIFGFGIYNVSVGTGTTGFTNGTGGSSDGYQDYSCTIKAIVLEGLATPISISTNQNVNENVRVWVDLNNNGIFDTGSELVFSSTNAKSHIGTFIIPVAAAVIKNTVLRMRVSADNFSSPLPTPCSTPVYSQVEDYGITVLPNNQKPVPDFSVANPTVCKPTVQFQNLTQNGTSYFWDFGDNGTSTLANPTHTYTSPGIYTVKLKACNTIGCDSITKTNYVTYHTNIPIAASCTPSTTNYCCGYGITNFTLHTLVNSSADGAAGYEDFTCTKSVTLQENVTYPVSFNSNSNNPQDFWIFIDLNNDGNFSSHELIYSKPAAINLTDNFVVPSGGLLNTKLRMRVIADATGNSSNACSNRFSGQVEDYSVTIVPNTNKPKVLFTSNKTSSCDTLVQFTDQSQNLPTTWIWDFGDGSPKSNLKNPAHVYNKTGVYTVKLIACNSNGCDTLTKNNFVVVTKPCPKYCIPSNFTNPNYITNVTLADLNHNSGQEPTTYGDYTNFVATVVKGNTYPISVSLNTPPSYYNVHIDFNQDGDFMDKGEYIAIGLVKPNDTPSITIPGNAKTGLTRMRIYNGYSLNNPCRSDDYEVEVEDYSLNILPNSLPPAAGFFTNGRNSCSYTVSFSDTSSNNPTNWLWDFGDPASGDKNYSTLQNPTHKFSGIGVYTIRLRTTNKYGSNQIIKTDYVKVNSNDGPRSSNCIEQTKEPQRLNGILAVSFNTINNRTSLGGGYQDYSCSFQTVLNYGEIYPITIETKSNETQRLRVWIDYNDDGNFDEASETVISTITRNSHTADITPPTNVVVNKFLRMRVINEQWDKLPPSPCNPVVSGQAEDYAVKVIDPDRPEEPETPDPIIINEVRLYPNPNKGTFSLEIPIDLLGNYNLELHDLVGKKILQKQVNFQSSAPQQLNLNLLAKGIYLLKLTKENSTIIKKIVIE